MIDDFRKLDATLVDSAPDWVHVEAARAHCSLMPGIDRISDAEFEAWVMSFAADLHLRAAVNVAYARGRERRL